MPVITVPRNLRERLGDEGADELVELLNKFEEKHTDSVVQIVADKFEKRLTEEISKVNERISEEISNVKEKISEAKADLIKWMFLFWIGQIGVILGILFAFF